MDVVQVAAQSSKMRSLGGRVGPDGFSILNTFSRLQESKTVDGLTRGVRINEEVKIVGGINIASMVETTKETLCCCYTEDFDKYAIGFQDGMVRLFKSHTSIFSEALFDSEIEKNPSPVTAVKHRPASKNYPPLETLTCTYANGCVKCWNYRGGSCVYTIREKRQTLGICYHPRLPKFLTCGDDSRIFLYDEETKSQERILSSSDTPGMVDGHSSRVFTCRFNPRSNHEFLSGGWDDIVYFWDLRQQHAIRHLSGVHMCGDGIDINSKGTEVLTAAWQKDNQFLIWDYQTGKLISSIEADIHNSQLYCAKYVTNTYLLAGGSDPHLIRIVDRRVQTSVASITNLPGGVFDFDIGAPKKKELKPDQEPAKRGDISALPKILFITGKKIYQIEF